MIELRMDIWHRATNDATSEVFVRNKNNRDSSINVKTTILPSTTRVNRESREEALKILFSWTIPGHQNIQPLLINLENDRLNIPVDHLEPEFFCSCYGSLNHKLSDLKVLTMRMNTACHFAHEENLVCPVLQSDKTLETTLRKFSHVEKLTLEYESSIRKMRMTIDNVRWVNRKAMRAKDYLFGLLNGVRWTGAQSAEPDALPDITITCRDPRRRLRRHRCAWIE